MRRKQLPVLLTPLERYEFGQVAKALGLPMSTMIRQAVRQVGHELGFAFGPNPNDPTSCPECGMAKGCDHMPGCPNA
jgi:hypothetical protein